MPRGAHPSDREHAERWKERVQRLEVVNQVLASGVSMAGIATALAVNPALPLAWRADKDAMAELPPVAWKNKSMAALATMAVVGHQLRLLGDGVSTAPGVSPLRAFVAGQLRSTFQAWKYRSWMVGQTAHPIPNENSV